MSARRAKKARKVRVFRTPADQRVGDVVLLVLLVPIAAVAAAFAVELGGVVTSPLGVGAAAVGGAIATLALVFKSRGWPAWTLVLEEEAALLGPFPKHRVPYEDVAFIAAGTWRGWLGHDQSSEAYALRLETRGGRVMTVRLKHSDADRALLALHARARNAGALDAEGHEHLPASGEAQAILAARARLAATWAPLVWLSFAGGAILVAACGSVLVGSVQEGEWGAASGALLIGVVGGWALGTAWWKALRRTRAHRHRVNRGRSALGASGQLPGA
jgi:hypothetical protein